MLHLMSQYPVLSGQTDSSSDVTREAISSYYANYPSMYMSNLVSAQGMQNTTNSQSNQTSFLIDDILGKRSRERRREKERLLESEREREIDRNEQQRSAERRSVERVRENELYERSRELERSRERERISAIRDREIEQEREEERRKEIERQREVDRENDRQSHLHSINLPKTISSSNSSAELARPTPINPAAIQTSALTTPTIYKPLPTMYDPTVLSQAYLPPHMSACQTTLMRQVYGALPYGRPDYPTLFDGQCNAFSKGELEIFCVLALGGLLTNT